MEVYKNTSNSVYFMLISTVTHIKEMMLEEEDGEKK
jgi:hypothetical protein